MYNFAHELGVGLWNMKEMRSKKKDKKNECI